jgi:hypothetical protein
VALPQLASFATPDTKNRIVEQHNHCVLHVHEASTAIQAEVRAFPVEWALLQSAKLPPHAPNVTQTVHPLPAATLVRAWKATDKHLKAIPRAQVVIFVQLGSIPARVKLAQG